MRESKVEQHFIRRVKTRKGEVRKVKWIGRRGAPDRLVLLPKIGHFLVELKRPGKKAEAYQHREHERLRAAGFAVFVLDTKEKINKLFISMETVMRFAKGKNYKLIEIDGALIICDGDQHVFHKKQIPLLVADAGPLLTYLDRFFFEREKGTNIRDAHDLAMKTAQVTNLLPCPGAVTKLN